jgi:flagellar motor component MotA
MEAATDEMMFWEETEPQGARQNVTADERFIETVSDGERRKLDRSRLVFDAILPTFPAIGFVGTVSSLLLAMSQADRIVSTEEFLAKGIAAARVTDILSLCFSTTLMALLCVLLFSPLSLVQAAQEQRLVDDVEEAVQTVLRPEQP